MAPALTSVSRTRRAQLAQRAREIGQEIGVSAPQGLAPADDDVVVTGERVAGEHFARRGAQTAARPVALDRISDLSGNGEANPGIVMGLLVRGVIMRGLWGGLKNEARSDAFMGRRSHPEEIGARPEAPETHRHPG